MGVKKFFNQFVLILLCIAAVVVFAVSFFTTIYYDAHVDVDFPHYRVEDIGPLLMTMACVFSALLLIHKRKWIESGKAIWVSLFLITAYCLTLIIAIKPLPVDDSKLLDDVLLEFAGGDYRSLQGGGGYLYTWPFQLGYFLFGQIMDGIFGHGNYFAWDIVNLLCILVTVYLLYKITWELFGNKKICGMMSLFSLGMLFFYNYSTYIYGDILSMAPQTMALYLTILFVKREKLRYGMIAGLFMGLAVLLKTNCEIAMIAIGIIFICSTYKDEPGPNGYKAYELIKRFIARCFLIAFMIIIVSGAKEGVNAHYRSLTGLDEIPGGSPSVSHIVMGLSESELEDGWYNGYNYQVFAENDYDTERTKTAATKDLKDRLQFFSQHPGYFVKFMVRKFITQWADPVCISTHNLDLVSRHVENPTALKDYLVFGQGSVVLEWIMNVFMSLCYLCVIIYLIVRIRSGKATTSEMLLPVLILGGMAFHQFWEGSSRYAMRYYVYWIPYASYGMDRLLGKIRR